MCRFYQFAEYGDKYIQIIAEQSTGKRKNQNQEATKKVRSKK